MLLALAISFAASAQAIDARGLTKAQIAELAAKAEEMKSPTNTSAAIRKEAEAWGDMGANMGKALVGAAKEVGVAANDFATTPLGKATMVIVAYKLVGRELLHYVVGSFILLFGLGFAFYLAFTKRWGSIEFERQPVLWGLYNRTIVKSYTVTNDAIEYRNWSICFTIVVTIVVGLFTLFS